MKIIQSYWSHPDLSTRNQREFIKLNLNKYMTFALSVLRAKKFYNQVELYTDNVGKELLIDLLELPYTKVHVCLDDLTEKYGEYSHLWALGKIYTYSLQNEPFFHVDNDAFICKPLDDFHSAPIVAQSFERNNGHHKYNLKKLKKQLAFLPEVLDTDSEMLKDGSQYNAGIIGGNDIAFFQDFCQTAFQFIDKNLDILNDLKGENICFPCIFEQYLFSCMAHQKGIDVKTLLPISDTPLDNFNSLLDFHDKQNILFIHLIGDHKKEAHNMCLVAETLWQEFPEYYDKIIKKYNAYETTV